jgi:uncharacterized membrane protein
MRGLIVLMLIVFVGFGSCSDDNSFEPSCSGVTTSFVGDVKPIIDSNCATTSGCHASGSSHGPGALTTYAQISAAKNSITSAIKSGSMPKTGSLTTNEKNLILCWIQSGAANN